MVALRTRPVRAADNLTTAELIQLCARRGLIVVDLGRSVAAGDLVIRADAGIVTWRGERYPLRCRACEIVAALAAAHPDPLTSAALAEAVWQDAARSNDVHVSLCHIDRTIPGLLRRHRASGSSWRGPGRLYGLNIGGEA